MKARWIALQGALHDVAPLLVKNSNQKQWKRWLEVPLALAVSAGKHVLVDKLLQAGADVSARCVGMHNKTLIDIAVEGSNVKVLQALLAAAFPADANARMPKHVIQAPLVEAMRRHQTQIAKVLIAARADPGFAGEEGCTALHFASRYGDVDTMQYLIALGADIDARNVYGSSPLWEAVTNNQRRAVDVLLDAGTRKYWPNPDPELYTHALCVAIAHRHHEIMHTLIIARANVNANPEGQLLQLAVMTDNVKAVHALLDAGVLVDSESVIFAAKDGRCRHVGDALGKRS